MQLQGSKNFPKPLCVLKHDTKMEQAQHTPGPKVKWHAQIITAIEKITPCLRV